jgi:hypothetical protein
MPQVSRPLLNPATPEGVVRQSVSGVLRFLSTVRLLLSDGLPPNVASFSLHTFFLIACVWLRIFLDIVEGCCCAVSMHGGGKILANCLFPNKL